MTERIRWQALTTSEVALRDSFAKGALESMISGLLSSDGSALSKADPDALAAIAYRVADAMMTERRR